MKQLHFFIGKGGVGKTTVSAAFAVRAALREPRSRVVLISTDPAHSLADILQKRLSDRPTPIQLPRTGHLDAWQINSEKLFADFLGEYKEDILDLIDRGSIFSREDIAPLLDTALPGMAEISALLAIRDAINSKKYSRIVVDTAPFGHTLRLFSLPEQFVRFLNFLELASSRDQILAEHFGGKSRPVTAHLLSQFRTMVEEIQQATSRQAELVLVTTREEFSLNEAVRCTEALREQTPPLSIGRIVLNRATIAKGCAHCERTRSATQHARKFLASHFRQTPIEIGADPGGPIMGTAALAAFGEHVFGRKALRCRLRPPQTKPAQLRPTTWPALKTRLCLVLGKGGVGKTATSAALAFNARHKAKTPVEICSVDPAPSLDDIFATEIGPESKAVFGDSKFRASELDAVALFQDWVRDLRSSVEEATTSEISGIHVDLSFERRLLSELLEIIPPGVDEVLAIFRIFDLVGSGGTKIVIDMAPTGHALELLRMPERIIAWSRLLLKTLAAHRTLAFARDAAAKVAEMSIRARELAALLKDPESSEINVVMLPETLPDRETERLIHELKLAKLPVKRIFINRVLMGSLKTKCRRCATARQWQQGTLSAMKKRYGNMELFVIRNFPAEIAGKEALQSFTGELWLLT